ncbi:transglutaminase-like cysteine peptidase [Shewanella litoralis]|uniref:transglutaminase-like cysteine peptidase n=1 Tax=Shewanella litoralis TaxID=2282700 RepID=UPI001E5E8D21|nr:transglutaminase-like cysteine peptidase [Shewanella litoralis]
MNSCFTFFGKMTYRHWLIVPVVFSAVCFASLSDSLFTDAFFTQMSQRYGQDKVDDFVDWHETISDGQNIDDYDRLLLANKFANENIEFKSDSDHWHKLDYWATPIESLGTGSGDCEDYAIFKYMTLIAMGMDEHKLRLMYVRALTYDEPHMVLIYFETPSSLPLVLDNLNRKVLSANRRPDLKPIYSFNGQGLWLAKAHGLSSSKPDSKGTNDWSTLMLRIENGE